MSLPVAMPQLARACRAFLRLAYPEGPESIPERRRVYYDLPADGQAEHYLPPAAVAEGVGQVIVGPSGGVRGYALRLGSACFPHLKLKLQLIDYNNSTAWVFMVDTHDSFSRESPQPPPDHPDAAGWQALQAANRELKAKIEKALEEQGLTTFHGLLRGEVPKLT